MSIADIIKKYGPRAGGVMIYNAAKVSTKLVNLNKKHLRFYPDTMNRLRIFFPSLDLNRVRVVENAVLPANWFQNPGKVEAMTFGWNIYSPESDLQYKYDGIKLLIHELNHVQQIRNLGETGFAALYGEEYLKYGYWNMPLEREAYSFVSKIPFDPSFYLNANVDVNGSDTGAFMHWLDSGIDEGRDSTGYFNSCKYLKNNEDLVSALGYNNFKAGILHWIQSGNEEGRKGN